MALPIVPAKVGDTVRLKKSHPCGSDTWEVTRVGMDVGLTCTGCGRKIRLMRREFDRRFKSFVRRSGEPPNGDSP